jgi:hypothetical protein
MNIIFAVLVAVPIGFFVKQRGMAILTYLALFAILFTFQTLSVLLDWLGPTQGMAGTAFGPKPSGFPAEFSNYELAGYGLVNLITLVAGVGLVVLGSYLARRRAGRRTAVSVA